jgi:protease IV
MGQFFKYLLATVLGIFIVLFLVFIIGIGALTSLAGSAKKAPEVKANSVLRIGLNMDIPELTNNSALTGFSLNQDSNPGLTEIKQAIAKAAKDEKIKGIFLEQSTVPLGFSTAQDLHHALQSFKNSGKFIVSYGDYISQGAFYMASIADPLIVNPTGIIDFRGLSSEIPFFKNILDKVGIKLQIYYAGQFKSATEPYRLTSMSEQNRMQIKSYLDELYHNFTGDIATARKIDQEAIKKIAYDYAALVPEDALKLGIVDFLGFEDHADSIMREKIGLDANEKINFIKLNDYIKAITVEPDLKIKDKIAVVYAEGTIVNGKGENGSIGDIRYMEVFKTIEKDDKIKAVVIRVNSPGGSALASENILRTIQRVREKGKPVIISMGDYAASGGYYLSCQADSIFAQPNTLTGSIGVFSIIPSAQEMLNDRLGINFDTVKTGPFANGISLAYDITPAEGAKIQMMTDRTYEIFLDRVSKARNMSRDEVHAVAQGRVWTGNQGVAAGLVDRLGTIDEAIEAAASLAKLEKYRTTSYPKVKDPLMQLLEDISTGQISSQLEKKIAQKIPFIELLETKTLGPETIQALLPYRNQLN